MPTPDHPLRHVTVIIPIYNAYGYVVACVNSVLRTTTKHDVDIVLVNDASTDSRIAEFLRATEKQHSHVHVCTHQTNLGFVGSANTGLRHAPEGDVVLLNSDTEVYEGWLAGLQRTADADPNTASVTAISNEASIYSIPKQYIDVLERRHLFTRLAQRLRNANRAPLRIPTGVGFCFYMTAQALETVGNFNEIFGLGYGEENDWCMRADDAGFHHYLDPNTFVYHKGCASMPQKGNKENEILLRAMHPQYMPKIEHFLATQGDQLTALKGNANYQALMAIRDARPCVVQLMHDSISSNRIGGTQHNVRDLVLLDTEHDHIILFPHEDGIGFHEYMDGDIKHHGVMHMPPLQQLHLTSQQKQTYIQFLKNQRVSLIHVHHLLNLSFGLISASKEAGIPVLYGIHDFFMAGSPQLSDENGDYIGVPKPDHICDRWTGMRYKEWHSIVEKELKQCDYFHTPSPSTLEISCEAFPFLREKTESIEHGIDRLPEHYKKLTTLNADRVLIMGYVHAHHKGQKIVLELAPMLADAGKQVYLLGTQARFWPDDFVNHPNIHILGFYDKSEVPMFLESIAPGIAIIPSVWPETYCHVVSECWRSGIPTCCLNFGAPAERTRKSGAGIIVDSMNPKDIAHAALEALKPARLLVLQQKAQRAHMPSTAKMRQVTFAIYNELMKATPKERSIPLPNLYVIGAQKCGTTWLWKQLHSHSDVCIHHKNETHYFTTLNAFEPEKLHQYSQQHFSHYKNETVIADRTAALFWSPTVAKKIATIAPNARLVLIARNPTIRALSAYCHYLIRGSTDAFDFQQSKNLQEAGKHGGIFTMGYYAQLLQPWLQHFAKEQFRFYVLEDDIARKPQATLRNLAEFVNIRPDGFTANTNQIIHAGPTRFWRGDTLFLRHKDDNGDMQERSITTRDELLSIHQMYKESIDDFAILSGKPVTTIWSEQHTLQEAATLLPSMASL